MERTDFGGFVQALSGKEKLNPVAVNISQHPFYLISNIFNPQSSLQPAGPADHKNSQSFLDERNSSATFTFHLRCAPMLILSYGLRAHSKERPSETLTLNPAIFTYLFISALSMESAIKAGQLI
jgi:hypothetical protein